MRLDSLECSKDVAKMRLPKIPLTFFATSYVLRQLRYEGIDFIARLKDLGSNTYELDQLWKVSAGDDQPKTLYVIFKSAEERKEFRSLASSLGWKDDELGLCLIDDFIKKHDRVKARLQSHQAPSEDNDNS